MGLPSSLGRGKLAAMDETYRAKQFPIEHFVPLEGNEHLLGRLVLNKAHDGLTMEIDIVLKEGRKIFRAVECLYRIEDEDEALHLGVQKLAEFLEKQRSS